MSGSESISGFDQENLDFEEEFNKVLNEVMKKVYIKRDKLEELAKALLERETLEGEELQKILED